MRFSPEANFLLGCVIVFAIAPLLATAGIPYYRAILWIGGVIGAIGSARLGAMVGRNPNWGPSGRFLAIFLGSLAILFSLLTAEMVKERIWKPTAQQEVRR